MQKGLKVPRISIDALRSLEQLVVKKRVRGFSVETELARLAALSDAFASGRVTPDGRFIEVDLTSLAQADNGGRKGFYAH